MSQPEFRLRCEGNMIWHDEAAIAPRLITKEERFLLAELAKADRQIASLVGQHEAVVARKLETLKAQLATANNEIRRLRSVAGGQSIQLRVSEAQVRELRELGTRLLAECRRLQMNTFDKALPDFALTSRAEAALRSAPPSEREKSSQALRDSTQHVHDENMQTNAGEERKDLARQGSDAGNVNNAASKADARSHRGGAASEQVPADGAHAEQQTARLKHEGWDLSGQPSENTANAALTGRSAPHATASTQSGPQDSPSRSEPKPPQHPFEVTIRIGGDTWDYVVRTLDELARHIPDHGPDCNQVSGGAGGSHSVSVAKRDITPEAFRKELATWHENLPAPPSPARDKEKAE